MLEHRQQVDENVPDDRDQYRGPEIEDYIKSVAE